MVPSTTRLSDPAKSARRNVQWSIDNRGFVKLDFILSLLFFLVQWRVAVILLRRIATLEKRYKTTARLGLGLFGILVVGGYACTFSEVSGRLPLPAKTAPLAGALALCYLLLSSVALVFHLAVDPLRRRWNRDPDPGRRRMLGLVGNAAMAAPLAAIAYGGLIKRTDVQIREVDIPLAGLDADLEGLQILHLSDIHLSAFLSEQELARMIDAACELRAHIAFATGDFVSTFGDPLEACIRQLARVKADAGMFGCLGNHEIYASAEEDAVQLGARAGIPILRGESRQLRFGNAALNIAGVDYQPIFRKEEYLRGAERLIRPGALNLLLSHNPDVFPVAARQRYDLVLAGHTHGGQVTVEILDQAINPARFFTPYVRGLYQEGRSAIYVTRGIGTIGIPVRLGEPPEISLLRLRKA